MLVNPSDEMGTWSWCVGKKKSRDDKTQHYFHIDMNVFWLM